MTESHSISQILEAHKVYDSPLVIHEGNFETSTVDQLLEEVDSNNLIQLCPNKLRKKIFNVSVEVLQNLNHSLKSKESIAEHSEGIFAIYQTNETVVILSGNFIRISEEAAIDKRILEVNQLESEELQELYRGVLENGSFTNLGGAGLGFIDIARKSGNKINHEFIEIDAVYSFFILKINING